MQIGVVFDADAPADSPNNAMIAINAAKCRRCARIVLMIGNATYTLEHLFMRRSHRLSATIAWRVCLEVPVASPHSPALSSPSA